MKEQFEYKVITLNYKTHKLSGVVGLELSESEAILTGEGLDGWEAVTSLNMAGYSQYILMKRKIQATGQRAENAS